ncbi:MAG TPA: hypothetical protein VFX59_26590, partial [Polyangiales bacterium]|nr:hypothetical protein [Polyangiales bacterium]
RVANEAVRVRMLNLLSTSAGHRRSGEQQLGSSRGAPVVARVDAVYDSITFSLSGVPWTAITLSKSEAEACLPFTRLDKKLEDLPNQAALARLQVKQLERDTVRAQEDMGKPFRHREKLLEERERLREIDAELELRANPLPPAASNDQAVDEREADTGGEQAVERWRDLLDQELARVVDRARSLEERLLARVTALSEEHALLDAAPRMSAGASASMAGGRAHHEAAHARWSDELEAIGLQQSRTNQRLARVREFLREPTPGYASPASTLSYQRLERRMPDLADRVRAYRADKDEERCRELAQRTQARSPVLER